MTKYFVTAFVLCTAPCMADVQLPKILESNMVPQQEAARKPEEGVVK